MTQETLKETRIIINIKLNLVLKSKLKTAIAKILTRVKILNLFAAINDFN